MLPSPVSGKVEKHALLRIASTGSRRAPSLPRSRRFYRGCQPETLAGNSAGTSAARSIFSGWGTTGTSGIGGEGVATTPAAATGRATRDFLSRYPIAPINKMIRAIKKITKRFPPSGSARAGVGVAAGSVARSAMDGPTTRTSLGGVAAAAGALACGACYRGGLDRLLR